MDAAQSGTIFRRATLAAIAVALAIAAIAASSLAWAPPAAAAAAWTKTYTPPGAQLAGVTRSAYAASGDLYAAITVSRPSTGTDVCVVRYAAAGARKWTRFIDGAAHGADVLTAIVADHDGNVTVLASSQGATTMGDWLLVRFARNGDLLWSKRVDGGTKDIDKPTDLLVDGSGNLYAVGSLNRPSTGSDVVAIKYAPSGKKLWMAAYDIVGQAEDAGPATLSPNGRLYIAGRTSTPATGMDILLVCFTTAGDYKWSRRWSNGSDWEVPLDVVADGHGPSVIGYRMQGLNPADGLVVAFDPAGTFRWMQALVGAGGSDDEFVEGGLDAAGRVYVAGYTTHALSTGHDFLLGRFGADGGGFQYTARNGLEDNVDEAAALAVTTDGHAYAAGKVKWFATDSSAFYLVYDATWTQQDFGVFDGAGNVNDAYQDVVLSPTAFYLTGTSGTAVLVQKYAR